MSTPPRGLRRWLLFCLLLTAIWAVYELDLRPSYFFEGGSTTSPAAEFFAAALNPAFDYEAEVPPTTDPLLLKVLQATLRTVFFAATAIALSIVGGLVLGFLGCSAWWSDERTGGRDRANVLMRRIAIPVLYGGTRILIAVMRSIHELIWAVIFLSAWGLTPIAAVVAIAIPFAGTLAKVFSEMIDEAPRDAAYALRAAGASPAQVFLFGLVPRVFAELCSYSIYRFECGLRAATILGFFGIPTLGYYLGPAFDNLHYREVWTYLYALFALVIVFEWWSGRLRRELVS